jgi:hypothetical protein
MGLRNSLKKWAFQGCLILCGAIEVIYKWKKDHLFLLHVTGHFVSYSPEERIYFDKLWVVGAVLCVHLLKEWDDTENRLPNVAVVMTLNVRRQGAERCGGPIGVGRIDVAAVLAQTLENFFRSYACVEAGFVKRLSPTATIVNTRIFQDLSRGRIRQCYIPDFGFIAEIHGRLRGNSMLCCASRGGSDKSHLRLNKHQ